MSEMKACHSEEKKGGADQAHFPLSRFDHVALGIPEGHVNFLFLLLSLLSLWIGFLLC